MPFAYALRKKLCPNLYLFLFFAIKSSRLFGIFDRLVYLLIFFNMTQKRWLMCDRMEIDCHQIFLNFYFYFFNTLIVRKLNGSASTSRREDTGVNLKPSHNIFELYGVRCCEKASQPHLLYIPCKLLKREIRRWSIKVSSAQFLP